MSAMMNSLDDTSYGSTSQNEENHMQPPQSNNTTSNIPAASTASSESALISMAGKDKNLLDRSFFLAILIAAIGAGVTGTFLGMGISGAKQDQVLRFEKKAGEVIRAVQSSFHDYAGAALWIHEACRASADQPHSIGPVKICTREDFRELHGYLVADGLEFQGMGFAPRVEHKYRPLFENESRTYYEQHYPNVTYYGFTGFEVVDGKEDSPFFRFPRPEYYPVHYVEPVERNQIVIDFDIFSIPGSGVPTALEAFHDWKPVLRRRVRLPEQYIITQHGYYLLLLHPGVKLKSQENMTIPDSTSLIMLWLPNIVQNALKGQEEENIFLYLFETNWGDGMETEFLDSGSSRTGKSLNETELEVEPTYSTPELRHAGCFYEMVPVAQNNWTIAVCHDSGYEPHNFYIILGAVVFLIAALFLAIWFYTSQRKASTLALIKAEAGSEKAALIVENAERVAAQERELNEYLSHEVRNPLAAAMSASSFVYSALQESEPFRSQESLNACRNDVHIVQSSLKFINDLLRSMLDMQKAASDRLVLDLKPVDVYSDLLEPIRTILDSKHNPFDFVIDCPPSLVVRTDSLRLKQVVMNLASNSRKFVTKGFIRIGAAVIDGHVQLFVEDSGPGVPIAKRKRLFAKYQESLDSLSQGTGIGLCLSKTLLELLGGELYLDETFDSGIAGFPGTRFVISTQMEPVVLDTQIKSR